MESHEQALRERLSRIEAQMERFEKKHSEGTIPARFIEDATRMYTSLCTDRQFIVDQLAEMKGALPNDRNPMAGQG